MLELTKGCSDEDVKRNYRRISFMSHPDRARKDVEGELERFTARFQEAAEAYAVLSDPEQRRKWVAAAWRSPPRHAIPRLNSVLRRYDSLGFAGLEEDGVIHLDPEQVKGGAGVVAAVLTKIVSWGACNRLVGICPLLLTRRSRGRLQGLKQVKTSVSSQLVESIGSGELPSAPRELAFGAPISDKVDK